MSLLTESRPWPAGRWPAPGGRVVVRDQRDERARDRRAGSPAPESDARRSVSAMTPRSAVGVVGALGAGAGQSGQTVAGAGGRRRGSESGGRGLVAGDDAVGLRASGGGGRRRPRRSDGGADRSWPPVSRARAWWWAVLGRRARRCSSFPARARSGWGWAGSCYERFPVFAQAFDEAVAALDPHLRLPLRQVIWGSDAELLESTEFAQPALFAVEVALAALLQHCGVVPDVVTGHSVGEITAAYVAGVLSLADAARVVAARGRLMAGLPAGGVMVAVAASEAEVAAVAQRGSEYRGGQWPELGGDLGCRGAGRCGGGSAGAAGSRVHRLAVSHAFHSVLMEPMLEEFAQLLAGVSAATPRIALVSNLTGQLAGPGMGRAQYWVEHVRQPVRFVDGVRVAESLGAGVFVEVGPGRGLTAAVAAVVDDRAGGLGGDTGQGSARSRVAAGRAGAAVHRGCRRGLGRGVAGAGAGCDLPTYGFVRQRFWLPIGAVGSARMSGAGLTAGRASVVGCGGGAAGFGWRGADGLVVGSGLAVAGRSRRRWGGAVPGRRVRGVGVAGRRRGRLLGDGGADAVGAVGAAGDRRGAGAGRSRRGQRVGFPRGLRCIRVVPTRIRCGCCTPQGVLSAGLARAGRRSVGVAAGGRVPVVDAGDAYERAGGPGLRVRAGVSGSAGRCGGGGTRSSPRSPSGDGCDGRRVRDSSGGAGRGVACAGGGRRAGSRRCCRFPGRECVCMPPGRRGFGSG